MKTRLLLPGFSLWSADRLSYMFLLLLVSISTALAQTPTIRFVKAGGTGNGSSWTSASGDLQASINASASGDQVWVATGTYKPTTSINRIISFAMKSGVAIYGGFPASGSPTLDQRNPGSFTTVLSGDIGTVGDNSDNSYHVVNNPAGLTNSAILDGFVITGGRASGDGHNIYGGGMQNVNSSPLIRNCLFHHNSTASGQNGIYQDYGGALYNGRASNPTLINCSFQSNSASFGGGIFNDNQSGGNPIPTLINCSFQGNSAGALFNAGTGGGSPSLTNCVLWGNGFAGNGTPATVQYSLLESSVGGYTSGPGNLTVTTSPFASTETTRLDCGSPAINTGDPTTTTATVGTLDLAGNPRFYAGGRVDMGAYEFQGTGIPIARFYVRAGAMGANTGLNWADAFPDLQSALNYPCLRALPGSPTAEIWVAGGIYKPGTVRTASFAMQNGVAIYGGFVGTETSLSQRVLTRPLSTTLSGELGDPATTADNSYHVISNPVGLTTTAVLDGFVITGGNANGSVSPDDTGGGMYNNGSGTGNTCSPLIRNCLFQGNSATAGGAIANAGYTGGSSSPSLINCAFQGNGASDRGGAILSDGSVGGNSNPSLINCSFQSNTATNGGAIYNAGYQGSGRSSLINCSFQSNSATTGGAIYSTGYQGNSGSTLTNCVVWGNGGASTFYNFQATINTQYSFFESPVTGYVSGTGNLTATTSPFSSSTSTQLATSSPAIDMGDPASTTATVGTIDLAGNPRFIGGRIDMGAYEFQGSSCQGRVLSIKAGSWEDPTVWSCGSVPVLTDVVQLNHAVSLSTNYVAMIKMLYYGVSGKLIYQTGARIRLGF